MGSKTPLLPSEDPWCKPPPRYQIAKPGTILRLRIAPGVKAEDYEHCGAVFNILFATTDSHYRPTWGITTVFVPKTTDDHALLSYQCTYNTVNVDGTPSSLVHRLKDHGWAYMIGNISMGLRRGWYVNFPDHEGPHAVFGNGLTTGHTTIDPVRAVLNAGFGMESPHIGLWGFSGGAIASAWATELQPHYAPELTFSGAALGGLPPSLDCAADLSGTPYSALIPVVLLGITKEDPDTRDYLLSQLKEERREDFLSPLHTFIDDAVKRFMNQDIWATYFTHGRESIMKNPLLRKAFGLTRLGYHGIPETPLFIYKAIHDRNSPIADTDELVRKWGNVDVNIRYDRNTVGEHVHESRNGRERAIEFLTAVLDGTYDHQGVSIRDVTIDCSQDAKQTLIQPVRNQ